MSAAGKATRGLGRSTRLTLVSVLFGAIFFVVLVRLPKSKPAAPSDEFPHLDVSPGTATAVDPAPAREGAVRTAAAPPSFVADDIAELRRRRLLIPVAGVQASQLRDNFEERRGARRHEALDVLAPRGTPVLAVEDGVVKKLFNSVAGGLTLYEFDPTERYRYSYAHLDSYAEGMTEGRVLRRGDRVGYVGTTGNAPKNTPHLHFTIARLGADKKWWEGEPLNPYLVLRER
ncbi:MAG: M23 family metallopeptidase [Thermoanaerobaculia bacterium]